MGNEANRSPQVAVSRRASQICGDERILSIKMQPRLSSVKWRQRPIDPAVSSSTTDGERRSLSMQQKSASGDLSHCLAAVGSLAVCDPPNRDFKP